MNPKDRLMCKVAGYTRETIDELRSRQNKMELASAAQILLSGALAGAGLGAATRNMSGAGLGFVGGGMLTGLLQWIGSRKAAHNDVSLDLKPGLLSYANPVQTGYDTTAISRILNPGILPKNTAEIKNGFRGKVKTLPAGEGAPKSSIPHQPPIIIM